MPERTPQIAIRDEFELSQLDQAHVGDVERKLTLWERVSNMSALRKLSVLVAMVVAVVGMAGMAEATVGLEVDLDVDDRDIRGDFDFTYWGPRLFATLAF